LEFASAGAGVGVVVAAAVSAAGADDDFSGSLLALWLTFNANSADMINVVFFIFIITFLNK
jgi:hypothetical protein